MAQSVLVYSFVLITMVLCGIFANQKEYSYIVFGKIKSISFWKFSVIFPIIVFSVIFGMRYDVGTDHLAYLDIYRYHDIPDKTEPLFVYLTSICIELNLHHTIYFAILAFIQAFFFFYALKNEKYLFPFLAFFLFTNGDWFFWMNGIRQAIAMCIWVYSIKYIEQRSFKWYFFWGIIAYLFHRSAIVLFIFYPLLKNGKDYFKNIPVQFILLFLSFVIRFIFDRLMGNLSILTDFYISFLGEDMYGSGYNIDTIEGNIVEQSGTGLAFLFKTVVYIIIILYSKNLKEFYDSKRFNIIYFFFFVGIITTYMFPAGYVIFTRPFRYFYIFQSIMLAYFLYYLSQSKIQQNIILYVGLIITFLAVFYLNLYMSGDDTHIWYQFFFQE